MPVRRTKKQKQQAQISRLAETTYHFDDNNQSQISQKNDIQKKDFADNQLKQLMISDPKDIVKDLVKTALVSTVILLILIAIFIMTK